MTYTDILDVVLPTFIVILIGYILGRTTQTNMTGLVDIVFYVGLPALAFVSILNERIVLQDAAKVWASALIVTFGCGIVGWMLFRLAKKKHSALYLPIAIANTVNIPFPIISLAYGASGLLVATLYYIPTSILLYSMGVFVAAGKSWQENLKTTLKVPAVYASIIALLLNLYQVNVPPLVIKPLSFIGSMVTPAVVLVLGYNLSRVKITSLPTTFLASSIRLGVGLALGFLAVELFHLTGVFRAVVILDSAMPAAVNTYMLATKYENEAELVASVVFVTTLASLALIPFLLRVLG